MSIGFRVLVSRHPAIRTTGRLTVTPAGLSPAEHASLRWSHNRTCRSPASGSPVERYHIGIDHVSGHPWMRRAPRREEAELCTSSELSCPSRQQSRLVEQCRCDSSEARLSLSAGCALSRSRGTRTPFLTVCIVRHLKPSLFLTPFPQRGFAFRTSR